MASGQLALLGFLVLIAACSTAPNTNNEEDKGGVEKTVEKNDNTDNSTTQIKEERSAIKTIITKQCEGREIVALAVCTNVLNKHNIIACFKDKSRIVTYFKVCLQYVCDPKAVGRMIDCKDVKKDITDECRRSPQLLENKELKACLDA